jgi:hypothetical protein
MELSGIFSDDQIAILGSFLALTVCGLITAISFRLGSAGSSRTTQRPMEPVPSERKVISEVSQGRRAA